MQKVKANLIIPELLKNRIETAEDLGLAKRKLAKKFGVSLLSNIDLLKAYHEMPENEKSKIKFYNNDKAKKFRLVIIAVSTDEEPSYYEKILE